MMQLHGEEDAKCFQVPPQSLRRTRGRRSSDRSPLVVTGGEEAAVVAQEAAHEGSQAQETRVVSPCVALRILYGKRRRTRRRRNGTAEEALWMSLPSPCVRSLQISCKVCK